MKEKRIELSLDEMTSISELYQASENPEVDISSEKNYKNTTFTQEEDDLELPPKPELIPLPEEPPKKKFSLFGRKKAPKEFDIDSEFTLADLQDFVASTTKQEAQTSMENAASIEESNPSEMPVVIKDQIASEAPVNCEPQLSPVADDPLPEVRRYHYWVLDEDTEDLPEEIERIYQELESQSALVESAAPTEAEAEIIDDTTTILGLDEEKQDAYFLIDLETNEKHPITKNTILVGCKSDDCDIVIKEEGPKHTISRKHAYFYVKSGKVYAKDVSRNGTFIGLGTLGSATAFYRLPMDYEVEVKPDQIIKFAERKFQLKKQ